MPSGYARVGSEGEHGTSSDAPMPCTICPAIKVDMVARNRK
jgi:hypothetical protein